MEHEIIGENNTVYFKCNDDSYIKDSELSDMEKELFKTSPINIRGNNNNLIFSVPDKKQIYHFLSNKGYKIFIFGNNNTVEVKNAQNAVNPNKGILGAEICIADIDKKHNGTPQPVNNCTVTIGNNTVILTLRIYLPESDSVVNIGDRCVLGQNTTILGYDYPSSNTLNSIKFLNSNNIYISDDVWIAENTTFYKNSKVSSYSIVRKNSVVCSKFDKKHLLISGAPAKIELEKINNAIHEIQKYMDIVKKANL